jgi:uncharacterized membrane protein
MSGTSRLTLPTSRRSSASGGAWYCLPFLLLVFACQTGDEPLAPGRGSPAASRRDAPAVEDLLLRATPPAMRSHRARARTALVRDPTAADLQPSTSQSGSVIIGEPTDLGTSFTNTASFGNAVNASGQLAGWTLGLADGPQVLHAIRWEADGTPVQLPTATAEGKAVAKDLNDAGVVVGLDDDLDPQLGPRIHAVRWNSDGSSAELPRVESAEDHVAEGINTSGVVVGWALFPPFDSSKAIRWDEQGAHLLAGDNGAAYDVNDAGTIVGYVETQGLRAARWSSSGVLTLLPLPEGATFAFAMGINNLGQIVGTAGTTNGPDEVRHAVIWAADGTPTVLPNPAGAEGSTIAEASKINDTGAVVGYVQNPALGLFGAPGVVWFGGEATPVPPTSPGLSLVNDLSETQLAGAVAVTESNIVWHAAKWSFTLPGPVFDFSGFFQPVANPGPTAPYVANTAQAGRALPIRFSLNGNEGLDILAAGSPASRLVPCTLSGSDGGEPTHSAGHGALSYHPGADQYLYVWKTEKAWAGTCRQFSLTLTDGTTHFALFRFIN